MISATFWKNDCSITWKPNSFKKFGLWSTQKSSKVSKRCSASTVIYFWSLLHVRVNSDGCKFFQISLPHHKIPQLSSLYSSIIKAMVSRSEYLSSFSIHSGQLNFQVQQWDFAFFLKSWIKLRVPRGWTQAWPLKTVIKLNSEDIISKLSFVLMIWISHYFI